MKDLSLKIDSSLKLSNQSIVCTIVYFDIQLQLVPFPLIMSSLKRKFGNRLSVQKFYSRPRQEGRRK